VARCNGQSCGILLVEDHATVLEVLRDLVRMAFPDEPLRCASNACEALALCREAMPAVVVMDIVLPDSNGFAVLGELRRLHEGVQVVMHSAFDDPVFRSEAQRLGAAAFVSKRDRDGVVPVIRRLRQAAHPWKTPHTRHTGFLADDEFPGA
jgi:DNA-binding NarL/FixJ family response regulator